MAFLHCNEAQILELNMKTTLHDQFKKAFVLGGLFFLVLGSASLFGQAINTKKNYIRIDQFGYPITAKKKAIIAKAMEGFNAGAGIDLDATVPVVLRKVSDDTVAFEAMATLWNDGGTDALSGDSGWWFDFSKHCAAGTYYIEATEEGGNKVASNVFEISNSVYDNILRVAVETFYYQRMAQDKTGAYGSGSRWTDGPWYLGAGQDTEAKYLYGEETKDVSGGWIDAGDPNKYITFATTPVHQLLTTYQQHPELWNRLELRIPENTNALPDLLDEIKWELDWIQKMQNEDGTVHSKAGIREDFNYVSPPSSDTRERWYAQTCPAAAITASGMMAHGAVVLRDFPSEAAYAETLLNRAELAWQAYTNAPDKAAICDNGEIEAGDADGPGDHYLSENVAEAVTAAVYLYEATGKAEYNDFVIANYNTVRPFVSGDWGVYRAHQSEAILYYTTLPNADGATANAIRSHKESARTREARGYVLNDDQDFYQVNPYFLNWGSNALLARQATDNYDYLNYGLDEGAHSEYEKTADGILHYFHGSNPLGMVFLSNMYDYGAEFSSDELWHTWFVPGGAYDGTANGVGPAPGFITGGVNPLANGGTKIALGGVVYQNASLGDQPGLKAYSDENNYIGGASESPWALVEPAIYYQSSYIKLLANYVARNGGESPVPNVERAVAGSLEIEDVFEVYKEAGDKSDIVADGSNAGASAGGFVRLFDCGDALSFDFEVGITAKYDLALRLRVGEASETPTSLAPNYEISIDGEVVTDFDLDEDTISDLDGDTYWGELKAARYLSEGTHTVVVAVSKYWSKADRFDFGLSEDDATYVDDISAVTVNEEVAPGSVQEVVVDYTAGVDREVVVAFQQAIAPYTVYDAVVTPVASGNGQITVALTIPEDVPIAQDEYQFQVYIVPAGGGFNDLIDSLPVTGIDVTDGTPPPGNTEGILEIEDVYEVVSDVGNNNSVSVDDYNPEASNGLHVRLFDAGDALRFDFNTAQDGEYRLAVRLRVGEATGTESNLATEYQISVDGEVATFELDEATITELDVDSHWGEMVLTTSLTAGIHNIQVEALRDWLKADRFSFELIGGDFEDDVVSVDGPDVVAPGGSYTLSVAYSASEAREINVAFQLGIAPYTTFDSQTVPVNLGTGTVEVVLNIPADVEIAADIYQFQTILVPIGGGWPDRLDNLSIGSVDVSDSEPDTGGSDVIEIEDVFEVVADVGTNNSVAPDSFNPEASNGQHVRLFDAGDELKFDFTASESGDYTLAVRLRVGQASGTDRDLVQSYALRVDGEAAAFTLDEDSISALDIDSYWGYLTVTMALTEGQHTINVEALADWLKADSFTFEMIPDATVAFEDDIIAVDGPQVVEQGGEALVTIEYSSSTDREVVGWWQLGVAPYTIFETRTALVSEGTGTLEFTFPIAADLAPSTTDYQIQILIVPPGGGWPERIDNMALAPVEVKASGSGAKAATYSVFPNPSSTGSVTVDTQNEFSFQLTDFSGRTVSEGKKTRGNNTLDINGFTPGLYILQTKDKSTGKVKTMKLMIK